MNKKLFTTITKAKALEEGVVEGIVATNDVDRQGERLDIKGLDIKTYIQTSGVVLYGHDYQGLPIGKIISLRKKGDELISRFQLAIDISSLASQVYEMIKGDFIKGLSVGFIGKEFDEETNTWTESEMLEFSVVPVPANSEALITAKSKGLETDKLEEIAVEVKEETDENTQFETLSTQVDALTEQVSALAETVKSASVTDSKSDKGKRRLVLVTAKKHAQIADKQVELIIGKLKTLYSIGADN